MPYSVILILHNNPIDFKYYFSKSISEKYYVYIQTKHAIQTVKCVFCKLNKKTTSLTRFCKRLQLVVVSVDNKES